MAPPAGTLRVGRYFLALLAILAVLYTIVFWPGQRHTPKLGLDLEGGTQVIFTAKTPGGGKPSRTAMNEAKTIMEQRVNGTGVTEATVVIQGNDQIVISIPGSTNADITKLGKAAALSMRGLVMPVAILTPTTAGPSPSGSTSPSTPAASGSASPSTPAASSSAASPNSAGARQLTGPKAAAPSPSATPSANATASPAASPTASSAPSATAPAAPQTRVANPFAKITFPIPTSEAEFQKLSAAQQQELRAALATVDCSQTNLQSENAKYYVACDSADNSKATVAYLLGDVIVAGHEIKSASAQAPNVAAGQTQWTVGLNFKGSGESAWAKYTSAHNVSGLGTASPDPTSCGQSTVPCAVFVGFTLDGVAISVPYNRSAINGGTTEISGSFTQSSAKELANQLKYGALPLSFKADAAQTVSATLGTSQLKAGLLAGGIGLFLVVIYSLIYYRALGLVTIASLIVSGVLTYGCLVMLATQIGFTLSLAGIAGFIVAVGITADSFVVFFERIKDEVHGGRSMRVAVPRAWVRARRTILSADTVSFLAAATLYYFAAGDVKGFAFTLGLSTILDLVVVFLFTHPLVSLLSRSKAFGSARFTGLEAARAGGIVPDTEATPARERAAAPTKPTRPARPAKAAKPAKPAGTKTAVLEREEEQVAGPDGDELLTPTDEVPEAAESALEPVAEVDEPEDRAAVTERRHTAPEPGSAAERAAARRARLRAQADEKGND